MVNLILSTPKLVGWEPSIRLFFSPYSGPAKPEPPAKFWTPTTSGDAFPDLLLDFPKAGEVTTFQFELAAKAVLVQIGVSRAPSRAIKPSSVPLWAAVALGEDDTLTLTAIEPKMVVGNVMHSRIPTGFTPALNCVARCADGTSGQGCVTCTFEDVTIKLCC